MDLLVLDFLEDLLHQLDHPFLGFLLDLSNQHCLEHQHFLDFLSFLLILFHQHCLDFLHFLGFQMHPHHRRYQLHLFLYIVQRRQRNRDCLRYLRMNHLDPDHQHHQSLRRQLVLDFQQ